MYSLINLCVCVCVSTNSLPHQWLTTSGAFFVSWLQMPCHLMMLCHYYYYSSYLIGIQILVNKIDSMNNQHKLPHTNTSTKLHTSYSLETWIVYTSVWEEKLNVSIKTSHGLKFLQTNLFSVLMKIWRKKTLCVIEREKNKHTHIHHIGELLVGHYTLLFL